MNLPRITYLSLLQNHQLRIEQVRERKPKNFWHLFAVINRNLTFGSLSYRDNDNVKKQLVFWAKQQLCACMTLFSAFLSRPLHNYDVLVLVFRRLSMCQFTIALGNVQPACTRALCCMRKNFAPYSCSCAKSVIHVQRCLIRYCCCAGCFNPRFSKRAHVNEKNWLSWKRKNLTMIVIFLYLRCQWRVVAFIL